MSMKSIAYENAHRWHFTNLWRKPMFASTAELPLTRGGTWWILCELGTMMWIWCYNMYIWVIFMCYLHLCVVSMFIWMFHDFVRCPDLARVLVGRHHKDQQAQGHTNLESLLRQMGCHRLASKQKRKKKCTGSKKEAQQKIAQQKHPQKKNEIHAIAASSPSHLSFCLSAPWCELPSDALQFSEIPLATSLVWDGSLTAVMQFHVSLILWVEHSPNSRSCHHGLKSWQVLCNQNAWCTSVANHFLRENIGCDRSSTSSTYIL